MAPVLTHSEFQPTTKDSQAPRIAAEMRPLSGLRLAPSTALLLAAKTSPREIADALKDRLGLWLVSAPSLDVAGRLWNACGPIAGSNHEEELAALLRLNPDAPVLADVPYENQDQEYLDAVALDRILKP